MALPTGPAWPLYLGIWHSAPRPTMQASEDRGCRTPAARGSLWRGPGLQAESAGQQLPRHSTPPLGPRRQPPAGEAGSGRSRGARAGLGALCSGRGWAGAGSGGLAPEWAVGQEEPRAAPRRWSGGPGKRQSGRRPPSRPPPHLALRRCLRPAGPRGAPLTLRPGQPRCPRRFRSRKASGPGRFGSEEVRV